MTRRRALLGGLAVGLAALTACAHLLGLDDRPTRFVHRAHVLSGIACVQCHVGMESAGEVGALHIPDAARCRSCHDDPHDDGDCLECHAGSTTRARVASNREHLRFEHARHLERVPGQCVRCHTGVAWDNESLSAPMAVCFTCHPHEEQFATRDCGGCHVDLHVEGSMPAEHFVHDMDFGRRHGAQAASGADLCSTCHRDRFCATCHGVTTAALPSTLSFDTPQRQRLHRAGFRARHAEEARAQVGLCGTCHADSFCAACHTRQGVHAAAAGARSPHPTAWLDQHGREARRDPLACASCHGGAGERLCIGCHRVGAAGGSVHPPGWTSHKRTSDAPCRGCHVP